MGGRVPRTQRPRVRPGEGWAPPGCTLPETHHAMTTHNHSIPDWSPPGSTRTAPFAVHQDGGVKYATGASSKIRGRDNITIGIWNTRTLRAAGKLQELAHEMNRYRWNIFGLCEKRLLKKKLKQILNDSTHPIRHYFDSRRSNRSGRFLLPKTNTNRYKASFYPLLCQFLMKIIIVINLMCSCVKTSAVDDDFESLSEGEREEGRERESVL